MIDDLEVKKQNASGHEEKLGILLGSIVKFMAITASS